MRWIDVLRGLSSKRLTLYSAIPCPNCHNPTIKLLSKRSATLGRRSVCPKCGYILEEPLKRSTVTRNLILVLASATIAFHTCSAQEVASLDLTKVESRAGLRRPKATSQEIGGYSGAQYNTPCLDSTHNTGTLHTSLVSLDRTSYRIGEEPTLEVTLQNSGSVPVRIPFSPNLADLQPKNPGRKFGYYELQITLWIAAGERWSTNMGGTAILYGADDHANTMLTLKPGEWARVVAKARNGLDALEGDVPELTKLASVDHAWAESSLSREETQITAKHSATVARELCIDQTHSQSAPFQLTMP